MFTQDYPKDFSEYKKDISLHCGLPKQFYDLRNKKFVDWEIPPWELLIYKNKKIGSGSFADVYLAKWRETIVVAKVFNHFCLEQKKFLIEREINIMTKLHHPNIVQILGYIEDPFIIVMEYIPKGDLLCNLNKLWKKERINIMKNSLQALAYLHNRQPESLIHRDIKLSNILITKSKTAKIADFGLSKLSQGLPMVNSNNNLSLIDNNEELTNSVGSARYIAPECSGISNYNHKIDIYSMGIVLYELFERKRYDPLVGFKWYKTPKVIENIIKNDMTILDQDKRLSALCIIKKINKLYPSI